MLLICHLVLQDFFYIVTGLSISLQNKGFHTNPPPLPPCLQVIIAFILIYSQTPLVKTLRGPQKMYV